MCHTIDATIPCDPDWQAARTLTYEDGKATPRGGGAGRLARENSLRTSTKIGAHHAGAGGSSGARAASTPLATPRNPSRFSQQQQQDAGAIAAAAEPLTLDASSDNIKVIVRVRPRNTRESSLGGAACVQPLGPRSLRVVAHPEPHTFAFDHVADESTSQEAMFGGTPMGRHGCLAREGMQKDR